MNIALYQVDAFAEQLFTGNPAAVCPLASWLPDATMQAIASENQLSETAFFVPIDDAFQLRWFTPLCEVDLCGHATLAAAYVLFDCLAYPHDSIRFVTRSGVLKVQKARGLLQLDFPAQPPRPCALPRLLAQAFSVQPIACLVAEDYLLLFEHEADIHAAKPDLTLLKKLDRRGVIITAKASSYDFVSRFFAPKCGIDEDPVTGSAHTQLLPYWAHRLARRQLDAWQCSARGGRLRCILKGDRALIAGKAQLYLQGSICLPDQMLS